MNHSKIDYLFGAESAIGRKGKEEAPLIWNTAGVECECGFYFQINDERVKDRTDDGTHLDRTDYDISLCPRCGTATEGELKILTEDEEKAILAEQERQYPAEMRAQ